MKEIEVPEKGHSMQGSQHLWILGLRRSGTTAVWRSLRNASGFRSFDEPFNPLLKRLPEPHRKGTWGEFIELYSNDLVQFKKVYRAIYPGREAESHLDDDEIRYLRYLSVRPTIIDFTRLNFKAEALAKSFPNSIIAHQFRSPIGFVSSNIINSENRRFLRQGFFKISFFSRLARFNSWGMSDLVLSPAFNDLVKRLNIKVRAPVASLYPYERLLLIWLVARVCAQNAKRRYPHQIFIASYEKILQLTCPEFERALNGVGLSWNDLRSSEFSPPSLGYRSCSEAWADGARRVGFNDAEISDYFGVFR